MPILQQLIANNADMILTLGSIVFAASQFRQLIYAHGKRATGMNYLSVVLFSVVVWSMAITYWALGLHMSSITVGISATLWTLCIVQRVKYRG